MFFPSPFFNFSGFFPLPVWEVMPFERFQDLYRDPFFFFPFFSGIEVKLSLLLFFAFLFSGATPPFLLRRKPARFLPPFPRHQRPAAWLFFFFLARERGPPLFLFFRGWERESPLTLWTEERTFLSFQEAVSGELEFVPLSFRCKGRKNLFLIPPPCLRKKQEVA